MKGYKVVRRRENGQLVSAYAWKTSGVAFYGTVHRTRRETGNGPLAVCDNLGEAESLLSPELEIWRCEYGPSKDRALWIGDGNKRDTPSVYMPGGTVFADWVILIEYINGW